MTRRRTRDLLLLLLVTLAAVAAARRRRTGGGRHRDDSVPVRLPTQRPSSENGAPATDGGTAAGNPLAGVGRPDEPPVYPEGSGPLS